MVPALVTADVAADVAAVRRRVREEFAVAEQVPSYRGILGRSGTQHAGDVMALGDEETVAAEIRRHFDAGATEVVVTQTGLGTDEDRRRTWRLLGELSAEAR